MAITDPALLGWGRSLPYQAPLPSDLFSLLVNLGLCAFSHSKLQEDILDPMKLVQIIFQVCYGVSHLASVLCHHIEVDKWPDASESTFFKALLAHLLAGEEPRRELPEYSAADPPSLCLATA